PRITYFRTPLPSAYSLGHVIPPNTGVVATDPYTAYYIPGATGDHVLTITKWHVGSPAELVASQSGYRLLRRLYLGKRYEAAAAQLWRRGVRWVVVNHKLSLRPRTLEAFSTSPPPLLRTPADRRLLAGYFWRLNRVARLRSDSRDFAVYKLNRPGSA